MQHLHRLSLRKAEGEAFTAAERSSWREPSDFTLFVAAAAGQSGLAKRLEGVWALFAP